MEDSRIATRAHIEQVRRHLGAMILDLQRRATEHDWSKLESPEREVFDEYTPKRGGCIYGSEEYETNRAAMRSALEHHYAHNSHHPEHYPDGIRGMSLLDLAEMLCDWLASTHIYRDGNIRRSIEINQARFRYSDELKRILLNTLPVLEVRRDLVRPEFQEDGS